LILNLSNKFEKKTTEVSIGHRATRGFLWLVGQTVLVKLASTAGVVILSWFLMPEDFGLVGLAYTVTAIVGLVQNLGLKEILIRRQKHYRRWVNAAFWLSLSVGIAAGVLMAVCSPLAAKIYGEPRLVGLICILSTTAPLQALLTIPLTNLQIEFRFRAMGILGVLDGVGTIILSVIFAALGFGAYSFVMPRPIILGIEAMIAWVIAPTIIHSGMHLSRWRFLLNDSIWLFGTYVLLTMISQGDYVTLGIFSSKRETGLYFFAFNLSMQIVTLITGNIASVLLPSLSKFSGDDKRQVGAFVRASRMISMLGMPLCFAQAVFAAPLFHLFFAPKWYPAIPIFQVLCMGMSMRVVAGTSQSMMQARGRYRAFFFASLVYLIVFVASVGIGFASGGVLGLVLGVAICLLLMEPLQYYVAVKGTDLHAGRATAGTFLPFFIAAMLCFGLSWFAVEWALSGKLPEVIRGVLSVASGTIAYLLWIHWFVKSLWNDVAERLKALWSRNA
jgi:PST family polysaccharide transporter